VIVSERRSPAARSLKEPCQPGTSCVPGGEYTL
jgi:hypothetical protein